MVVVGAGQGAASRVDLAGIDQLRTAGDRLHRDAVDRRTVDGVRSNTGKIIDTPEDVGGWPSYTATSAELALTVDTDGDGIPDWFEEKAGLDRNAAADGALFTLDPYKRYTNLEMYLHYLTKY